MPTIDKTRRKPRSRRRRIPVLPMAAALGILAVVIFFRKPSVPMETLVPPEHQVTEDASWQDESIPKAVRDYAREQDISCDAWPQSMLDLLERNPETLDFVLQYPDLYGKDQEISLPELENMDGVPLFLQWDPRWGYISYGSDVAGITGCGPVCLSMAACYLTGDPELSPDKLLRFSVDNGYCVSGNGSAWTLISQGGEALGLTVTELPLMESSVFENLEAGNPIICIMGPGDFTNSGHFVVMVGCENGKIRINDPNSREKSAQLWDFDRISGQIDNLWAIQR